MLKGLSPLLTADLLWVLESMGHGDELALVDRNFPAASVAASTTSGRLVELRGTDDSAAARAILSVLPLDSFVAAPIRRMEVVGAPETVLAVHRDVAAIAAEAAGQEVKMGSLERHAFYAAARQSYAVVQTAESRPYGCFLLKKGVIFD